MKKKYFWNMLAILMVTMMSVSFISCGGDDEGSGGAGDSAIIGKWYSVNSTYTAGWMFNSNGSRFFGEWGNGRTEKWGDDATGKWSTSGNTLTVTWTDEEGSDVEKYTYTVSNDGKTLTLTNSKGKTTVYTKQ